jgi:hypothetical protein
VSVVETVVSFVLLILGMWYGGVLEGAGNEASNLVKNDIPSGKRLVGALATILVGNWAG